MPRLTPEDLLTAAQKPLETAKILAQKALPALPKELTKEDVKAARQYIKKFWKRLERSHLEDDESLIGLPNKYLVPASEERTTFDFNEMYYWDSYFMIQGLLDEQHKDLVLGMLDNLITMFERFKVIPNASRTYLMGRSQPPFLTSFIRDCYEVYNLNLDWLTPRMAVAEQEYFTVWKGTKKPNERLVYAGLSRYYDINYLHDLAEAESGWDMTTRFSRKALNYLPVDLNALLYKYETDFAWAAELRGDKAAAHKWQLVANGRADSMTNLMWDGLFYDYNYVRGRRSGVASLATYYPMWAGLATPEQAASLVKSLRRFDEKGGLVTTDQAPLDKFILGSMPTQWAYPNGWAPLVYLTVRGLERYGYHDEARHQVHKWLRTNLDWFNVNGIFLEKYNVVNPDKPPAKGVYPSQTGFGWTNAVFERFCKDYID